MRFLCVSDLVPERSSEAAGSILAIGEALTRLGHDVDYRWHEERPYHLAHETLRRRFQLPRCQLEQVTTMLDTTMYDVVIVRGMSCALLKLSGSLVHDYATISDDSPSPNRAARARRAATSAGIS